MLCPCAPPPYQNTRHGCSSFCARDAVFFPTKLDLFGRNDVIKKIVSDLTTTNKKCIMLVGAPGCGKTAVAIASCHELIDKGIICNFVDLRSIQSSKEILQAILASLCYDDTLTHVSPNGRIFEVLHRAGEKRVFLLDNAEGCLTSDDMKDDIIEITKKICMVRDVKVIITSRVSMRICQLSIKKYHLKELTQQASLSMLTSKVPINTSIAAELAYQCGYIPLALEVIAALVEEHMKPEDILNSLEEGKAMKVLSPEFLSSKEKLISCMSTSYDCLDVQLRSSFVSLAVFPRSFCVNAAAAVLGVTTEEARNSHLNPLTRRSLLEFDEAEDRWTFHVLLRSFALATRSQDPVVKHLVACKTYQHRFCSFYIKFLQQVSQNFIAKSVECIKQCQVDFFNIQETLKLASDPVFAQEFLCLTDGVVGGQFRDLLNCVASVEDQLSFYKNCVADAQRRGNLEREAVLLCDFCAIYMANVNCTFMTLPDTPGKDCLKRILNILETLDVEKSVPLARCLAMAGHLEMELLQFDRAVDHLKKALSVQEANGDFELEIARTLTDLGNAELASSHENEAKYFLNKSHAMLEHHCKSLTLITSPSAHKAFFSFTDNKRSLGHLYLQLDQVKDALKVFQEANDLCQIYAPFHPDTRFSTDGIAHCYLRMKDYEKAIMFYEESLELRRKIVGVELPVNTKILSYVYFEMGEIEKLLQLEREVMLMWERSMHSNLACMKMLRDEKTRKFVFTVFYAMVESHQRKTLERLVFKYDPATTREIRIREFTNAMWSSERVTVMHLEPNRYAGTATYLKTYFADNVIGEICADSNEDDWETLEKRMQCWPDVSKNCLLIIRPMPAPFEKPPRRLSFLHPDIEAKLGRPVASSQKNRSKFCTVL